MVFVFMAIFKESIQIHINSPHKVVQVSHQIGGHGLGLLGGRDYDHPAPEGRGPGLGPAPGAWAEPAFRKYPESLP